MRQIAAAVGELHKLGYVHRDIKPSNILWRKGTNAKTDPGRAGSPLPAEKAVPVLIDLGLAKPISNGPSPNLNTLSVDGGKPVGVGTPGYAAPEQFTGGEIGVEADIHALGVLANECFGGKPPKRWARIIDSATSSIAGRRFRSVKDLLSAIAFVGGNAVWFRSVLVVSSIPLIVSLILFIVTLIMPLMPPDVRQIWFGSASFVHGLKVCLVFVAATSIIPLGILKLNKWVVWFAMIEGAFFLLGILCIMFTHERGLPGWFVGFDTGTRLSLIFWLGPRIVTFFLLMLPKVRALFNR